MRRIFPALRERPVFCRWKRITNTICNISILALASHVAMAQAPAPQPDTPAAAAPVPAPTVPAPSSAPASTPADAPVPAPHADGGAPKDPVVGRGAFTIQTTGGEIKEDQLKQLLVGKTLYLRGGYQDNNLEFDDHGRLVSRSAHGSYTLSQIQINKVKLSKRKLELDGPLRSALPGRGSV